MKRFGFILCAMFFCITAIAQTISIDWKVGDTTYSQSTCEYGGDLNVPTPPTKYGYTFQGWVSYTPIEYLESTGTQWIDTEYVLQSDIIKYECKFIIKSKNTSIFGSQNLNNVNRYSGIQFFTGSDIYSATGATSSDGLCPQRYTAGNICELDININNGVITKTQDNQVCSKTYDNSVRNGLPIALFGDNFGNSVTELGTGSVVYYFQIYDNNILVRDFIPVLDYNGTPCMFDKVEKKFYYNAGTGQFIAGPVLTE